MPTPPIASPAVWLRADLGITLGTGVSTWADQSGNGNDATQGTAGDQPAYNTSDPAYSKQPTVQFNGSTDYMLMNALFPPQPYTAYVVGESTSGTGNEPFFTDAGNGSGMYYFSTGVWGMYAGGTISSTNAIRTPQIFAGIFNTSSSDLYINDPITPAASGNISTVNPSVAQYLGTEGLGSFLTGKIAELIIYSGVHTQVQVSTVFDYFSARYWAVVPGAPLTLYFSDVALGDPLGSGTLQIAGIPPTVATMADAGWILGTVHTSTEYSALDYGSIQPATSFSTTGIPVTTPLIAGSTFRSTTALTGTFAAGTWTLNLAALWSTLGTSGNFDIIVRIWHGSDTTGTNESILGTGVTGFYPITTSGQLNESASIAGIGSITLVGEYIFVQLIAEILSGAVTVTGTELQLIQDGLNSYLLTPAFTSGYSNIILPTNGLFYVL